MFVGANHRHDEMALPYVTLFYYGNLLAHTAWPLEDKTNTMQHNMQHTTPPSTQHTTHGLWVSGILVVVCSCLGLWHFVTAGGRFLKDAWWSAVLGLY